MENFLAYLDHWNKQLRREKDLLLKQTANR